MAQKKATSYIYDNHKYGNLKFNNQTELRKFYRIFFGVIGLVLLVIAIVAAIVLGLFYVLNLELDPSSPQLQFIIPLLVIPIYMVIPLVVGSYQVAATTNAVFGATTLAGKHTFAARFRMRDLFFLYLKYGFLTIITLGFGWPWFKVAMARYKAGHINLNLATKLDDVVDEIPEQGSAIGDELGDAFDLGAGIV